MKLPFPLDLSGQTAVVTGGSGVLGAELARALAACGARVAILARREESANAVLEQMDGEGAFFQADVTDRASLERARQQVLERFGRPSVLINGAGGNNPKATT
ncbi:MAG TPA: SDR family NAD(P)-dependent oxidoreductase, partial [Clostridia bacterium]|nr:SDR family NAD(P)-dependent oxidoreductase [Clostridia bacterium]